MKQDIHNFKRYSKKNVHCFIFQHFSRNLIKKVDIQKWRNMYKFVKGTWLLLIPKFRRTMVLQNGKRFDWSFCILWKISNSRLVTLCDSTKNSTCHKQNFFCPTFRISPLRVNHYQLPFSYWILKRWINYLPETDGLCCQESVALIRVWKWQR